MMVFLMTNMKIHSMIELLIFMWMISDLGLKESVNMEFNFMKVKLQKMLFPKK